MSKKEQLVSIIIPAKFSGKLLVNCLQTIRNQTYKNIEIIIVDSDSRDGTEELAQKYHCRLYHYFPKVKKGLFDAPHKRNFGAKKARGAFIYYIDADMELTPDVISEAVHVSEKYDAIIIREESFGTSIWAKAKWLEKRSYWGDDAIEAPRFIKKDVWDKLGGLDELLGGGGDDWDFYQKLLTNGYTVGRIHALVMHNEGNLSLKKLWKKRFMYGQDALRYISKRPLSASRSYFPLRKAYTRNWRLFAKHPVITCAFIFMRSVEISSSILGIIYSVIISHE